MANELTILFDCKIHVFAFVDHDAMPAAPTGTDLIPLGWSDKPVNELSANKMNVWSYSDYDFENNCSLGNWSTPIPVIGSPLGVTLDYGFHFGYSNDPNTPPSTWGKIFDEPTGAYMWMEKYRIINSEAIRTLDFILINNESERYKNFFRGDIIREYNYVSESMNTRVIGDAKVYKNTADADDYYTGKEYVIYNNEKYYLDVKSISKSYNKDAAKYVYSLSFNNEYHKLFTTPFKNIATINEEPQFYTNSNVINFVGNIGELKDRINACLTKSYSSYMYQVSYDSGFAPNLTNYQEVSVENITIFDALKLFYDIFSVPFYIEGYNIILGREPNDIGHTFEYGNGIKEMTKGKSKDFVTTSVSGKGGQTNIPFRYPVVRDSDGNIINHPYTSTYLMPTCFVDSVRKKVQTDAIDYDENTLIVNSYEAKPNDVYIDENGVYRTAVYENYINANNYAHEFVDFDEIYPTITGVTYGGHRIDQIKSVSYQEGDTFSESEKTKELSYFFIELYPMGFDLYDRSIETGEMTISMNSGACSGCQFKVVGNFNRVWSQYNIYFAKQNSSGSYQASDFMLFYDKDLFNTMLTSINMREYFGGGIGDPRWESNVTQLIKSKIVNGLNIHTLLKQNIDILMTYEDIYVNIFSENFSGDIEIGNNLLNTAKEEIYLLYNNWNTYTNAEFSFRCVLVDNALRWLDDTLKSVQDVLMKDYTDATYPPEPPYFRGDFFLTKFRNTTDYPDSTNASITLKVLKDDSTYGTILPNQFVRPKANDTFTILNIDMPNTYLVAAQRRLDKALRDYLSQKNKENPNYTIELSQVFLANNLTVYNKIKTDTYMNFKFKGTTVSQQIKRITKKYKNNFPEVLVEFYADEEKKKSIGNKIVALQQIVASTRREVNVNNINNRKLLSKTTEKIVGIEKQQTTISGLVESKNKMFITTPTPPYRQGDTWNDGTVLRRCNNTKTEGQSYSSGDWDIAVKTQQFVVTLGKEITNELDHQQSFDFQSTTYVIDDDSTLFIRNDSGSKTENILIIENTNKDKATSLSIDVSYINGDAISDIPFPISIDPEKTLVLNIKYNKEGTAIITTNNGLTRLTEY